MARARNIKPGFYLNESLAACSIWARHIFPGLWMLADRSGRLEDRPLRIKAALLPYDAADMNALLGELHAAGMIQRYKVAGIGYIEVLNFEKHQNPHVKEAASTIPAPDKPGASPVQTPDQHQCSPADSLLPLTESLLPFPDSGFRIPESPTQPPLATPSKKPRARPAEETGNGSHETWSAYSQAYQERYGVPPVRNLKTNSLVKSFCERVSGTEAPLVAAWYVGHQGRFYVQKGHPLNLLLNDAESLRTQWATQRTITETQARQADRTQATGAVFRQLIQEVDDEKRTA